MLLVAGVGEGVDLEVVPVRDEPSSATGPVWHTNDLVNRNLPVDALVDGQRAESRTASPSELVAASNSTAVNAVT